MKPPDLLGTISMFPWKVTLRQVWL